MRPAEHVSDDSSSFDRPLTRGTATFKIESGEWGNRAGSDQRQTVCLTIARICALHGFARRVVRLRTTGYVEGARRWHVFCNLRREKEMKVLENSKRGRLVREVPVRLMDASLSGCLVESDEVFQVGAAGTLHVDLWGVPCRYPVRVTRVLERPDTSHTLRVAGEFTWKREGRQHETTGREGPQVEPPLDRGLEGASSCLRSSDPGH